jgi:hypothetical protein
MNTRRLLLLWVVAVEFFGCGRLGFDPLQPSDASTEVDAGFDASFDQGMDAGDAPSISVTPTSGLSTTELGGVATFTVVLGSQPAGNVTMGISSSDASEGRVAPLVVAFTPTNWSAPQTVTVTGVDDADADGPQPYTVVTAPAVSSDARYNAINAEDVSVTNIDNETAGVTLSRTSGLATTETGGTDAFTVVLNAAPAADVAIALSSSVATEASVSPALLTFTLSNWSAPQTVQVTGVDDSFADGDQLFTIVTSATTSASAEYNGVEVDDATGVNHDDETPGILVSPTSGLSTAENGATASFTIVLQAEPGADVSVPIVSSDTSEGTVASPSVVFTSSDWNMPQAIVVTGVDDAMADGDQIYTIGVGPSTSTDAAYSGISGPTVSITNVDDESAAITVTPTMGLVTTEAGGADTFTVVLNTQPATNVVLEVSSSDLTEGVTAPATLTFTNVNWSTPQTISVTGVDDASIDGNQLYSATVHVNASSDAAYAALADKSVSITNTDDETAGITVTPSSGLTTTEFGGTATFSVVLNSIPTASVIVDIASDLPAEGTISEARLTFTPATWNVPQIVTVTGEDDIVVDGARVYHVITSAAVSGDPNYAAFNASDVTLTNLDNDMIGIDVSPSALTTVEGGATAAFSVVLRSQPSAAVTVPLRMANTTQGSISPMSLVFTSSNWATPRTVTVTATNDAIADGDFLNTAITDPATSTDLLYAGFDAANVMVTNADNDTVGVVVTPTTGLVTTESGGTASFTMRLLSQPSASVTVSIASSDATEGIASPGTLTFTTGDWSSPHLVTITGQPDGSADGDIAYNVITGALVSADSAYNGLAVTDVSVTNLDNNMPGISVSPVSGLTTTEAGATATFNVVLVSMPSADVTISLTSSDVTEGTVSPSSVTFTMGNWNIAQTVTVTGVDDPFVDGTAVYTIVTGNAVSADGTYSGRAAADVSVSNTDNDVAGVVFSPTAGPVFTWEGGASSTFTVRLASQPSATVTIPLASDDASEGSVAPSSLVFTTGDWNTPQSVTVSGVDDSIIDDDQSYHVVLSNGVSADPGYAAFDPPDFLLSNMDDDGFVRGTRYPNGTITSGSITPNALSEDGRYMAYWAPSFLSLDPADTNGVPDIYVMDRATLTHTLVSVNTAGVAGNNYSWSAQCISDNGLHAAFNSLATNLDTPDTNGFYDSFVRHLSTHVTIRASVTSTGGEPNDHVQTIAVSTDGRFVLFTTAATNMVPADTNGVSDVYLRDTVMNVTTLVSVSTAGVVGNQASHNAQMTPDARFVVFLSASTNLVAGDTNATLDVFVRDTQANTTTRVSLTTAGTQSALGGSVADISADGRYVAFVSAGTEFSAGDTNGKTDVFLRDTMLNTTTRISKTSTDGQLDDYVASCFMSSDGQRIAYLSAATNIVPGDTSGSTLDVFAYDRVSDMVTRLSVGPAGQNFNQPISNYSMSGNGRYVAISTQSNNIFSGTGWGWVGVARFPF